MDRIEFVTNYSFAVRMLLLAVAAVVYCGGKRKYSGISDTAQPEGILLLKAVHRMAVAAAVAYTASMFILNSRQDMIELSKEINLSVFGFIFVLVLLSSVYHKLKIDIPKATGILSAACGMCLVMYYINYFTRYKYMYIVDGVLYTGLIVILTALKKQAGKHPADITKPAV